MLEKPKSIFDEPEAIGMRAAAPVVLNPNKVMAEYMEVMNEIAEKQLELSEWVHESSNPDVNASEFLSLSASGETAEDRRTAAAEGFESRKDALQSLIAKAKALKAQMDSL